MEEQSYIKYSILPQCYKVAPCLSCPINTVPSRIVACAHCFLYNCINNFLRFKSSHYASRTRAWLSVLMTYDQQAPLVHGFLVKLGGLQSFSDLQPRHLLLAWVFWAWEAAIVFKDAIYGLRRRTWIPEGAERDQSRVGMGMYTLMY